MSLLLGHHMYILFYVKSNSVAQIIAFAIPHNASSASHERKARQGCLIFATEIPSQYIMISSSDDLGFYR